MGLAPLAEAAPGGLGKPDLPEPRAGEINEVRGLGAQQARAEVARSEAANRKQAEAARRAAEKSSTWPEGGTVALALPASGQVSAEVGGLPVEIRLSEAAAMEAPGEDPARITVLDQDAAEAAGVTGVLLTADLPTADGAQLRVNYGAFASAVGGDWAGRLGMVELPACVLTTPERAECREQTPLDSSNDHRAGTVTATSVGSAGPDENGPVVLALTAAAAGAGAAESGSGDYSATPLAESASWEAGSSSGSFTWSYDLDMPPVAAGPVPGLGLSYDSGSVDGRTSTTNNQGSLVGEGFGLTDSYIERSYASCDDEGHDEVYDQCWKYDNATLVLNGRATKLIKDDTTGDWRLQNDDASQVTRATGAANGDDDGEHWTVITGDGTRYVFGLDKLSGAGTERTNSVWTVPVFGDNPGEPGYDRGSAFKDRAVAQAWRWNLDYVEDTAGNAMTYWYRKETNHYKKNGASSANASYTRGGYLTRIDFGQRKGSLFTREADARVRFSYAERCTAADCTSLTKDTAENWPDVPFDSICTSGDGDCRATGPNFFTRKRLTGVTSYSWDAGAASYAKVDSWALAHRYLDPGDIGSTKDNVLVLTSVRRTGHTGTDIATNPVTFTYHMRPNRVDGIDDILPITRPRLNTITSESGGIVTVTYSDPECTRAQQDGAAEDLNTRNCFPQYWHINGAHESSVDWFHKYRVTAVVVSDPTGHNEPVEYTYGYSGAAWAYNHEPFIPADDRTWSQWRGYRTVTTRTGNLQSVRTRTTSVYFQGMHGDRLAGSSTRNVQLAAVQLPGLATPAFTDRDEYSGMLRQSVTYNGSTAIAAVVHDPWSQTTATQTVAGVRNPVARYVRTRTSTAHTYLTASQSWRSRASTTTYDSYGMPVMVADSGDLARSGDETCTRTWYARNAAARITALESRTRTVGRACSVTEQNLDLPTDASRRGDILSDVATVYDNPAVTGWSPSQTPTRGMSTWTGRPTGYRSTASGGERHPTGWQTTATATYDVLGRTTSTADAEGNTTTTAYTPAAGGPVTRIGTTNALGHTSFSFYDPRRAQLLRSYDANQKKTELSYDALGRLTAVWQPHRNRAAGYEPNLTFSYSVSNTRPSYIATGTLRADGETYNTTYEIYDGLLRPLQVQTPSPQGGRLLTDTRYNSLGQPFQTYADIFDPETGPRGQYARAEYGGAPKQHNITFDAAGRETANKLLIFGEERWTVRTTYTGDSTAVSGVAGGTAERVITDALGNTVEKRTYNGPSPADPQYGGGSGVGYLSMEYRHHLDGVLEAVTGPEGNSWSYTYDLHAREIRTDDSDRGTSVAAYNVLDQVVSATDAKGDTVLTRYDALSRPTGTWDGRISDATRLTEYTYDRLAKGQPDAAIRYVGGKNGRSYGRHITEYDSLYRATASELRLDAADPMVAAGVPATIPLASRYRIDGTLGSTTEPALGGMPSEVVSYGYNQLGMVTKVGGATGYLLAADYSDLGQLQQMTLGTSSDSQAKKVYLSNTFEQGTGRLLRSHVTDQTHPYMLQDLNYAYDDAGNVLSITDPSHLGNTSAADNQCFAYDGQRRLVHAWTPRAESCATADRRVGNLGGAAPYWTSYTYDDAGSRTSETRHAAGGAVTTTYCYADPALPKALTGITTGTDCTDPQAQYGYDAAGNTTSRPGPDGSPQTLDWTVDGRVSEVADSDSSTSFLYDAEGAVLIRYNPDGESVLYAGATEFHLRSDGTAFAQRYYLAGDQAIAVRTNESGQGKVSYLAGDHHGTSSLAIDALSQNFVKRYTAPFGVERTEGATGTWIDDKGFLGKTDDTTTGLTHIGARQYDPLIGRFLSVDPIMDLTDPQQIHGYAYANNNPLTFSDPSGLKMTRCSGRTCSVQAQAADILSANAFSKGTPWTQPSRKERPGPQHGAGVFSHPSSKVPREVLEFSVIAAVVDARRKEQLCDFNPIALACNPEDAVRTGKGPGMLGLTVGGWAGGLGGSSRSFGEGSEIATLLGMSDTLAGSRWAVMDAWFAGQASGRLSGRSIGKRSSSQQGQTFIDDSFSILGYAFGQKDSSTAEAFLGSFNVEFEVLTSSDAGIQVRFTVRDTLSVSSFAHIATGYGTPAEKFVAGMANSDGWLRFGTSAGPGRDLNLTVQWRETLYFEHYGRPGTAVPYLGN